MFKTFYQIYVIQYGFCTGICRTVWEDELWNLWLLIHTAQRQLQKMPWKQSGMYVTMIRSPLIELPETPLNHCPTRQSQKIRIRANDCFWSLGNALFFFFHIWHTQILDFTVPHEIDILTHLLRRFPLNLILSMNNL